MGKQLDFSCLLFSQSLTFLFGTQSSGDSVTFYKDLVQPNFSGSDRREGGKEEVRRVRREEYGVEERKKTSGRTVIH